MAQITDGIRSALSIPIIYSGVQALLGASRSRKILCADHIRAAAGDVIIDVGCGPAEILDYIQVPVRYYGFDFSEEYVESARRKFGNRGSFFCSDIALLANDDIPPCQLAIAVGLLHHLDDHEAAGLIAHLRDRLAPGGRLVTVDPSYWPSQSRMGRFLISKDRGQNVRNGDEYRELVPNGFSSVKITRRDDLLHVPYSHAILECTK